MKVNAGASHPRHLPLPLFPNDTIHTRVQTKRCRANYFASDHGQVKRPKPVDDQPMNPPSLPALQKHTHTHDCGASASPPPPPWRELRPCNSYHEINDPSTTFERSIVIVALLGLLFQRNGPCPGDIAEPRDVVCCRLSRYYRNLLADNPPFLLPVLYLPPQKIVCINIHCYRIPKHTGPSKYTSTTLQPQTQTQTQTQISPHEGFTSILVDAPT